VSYMNNVGSLLPLPAVSVREPGVRMKSVGSLSMLLILVKSRVRH